MVLMEPHLGQVLELCSWPVNSISKGSLAAVSCAQRLRPLSASFRLASSASFAFFSASSPFFGSSFFLAACEGGTRPCDQQLQELRHSGKAEQLRRQRRTHVRCVSQSCRHHSSSLEHESGFLA